MTLNLDKIAAEHAQNIVTNVSSNGVDKPQETLDRLVTKTLGVLQEQGVYAMMLFLFSRSKDEEEIAPKVRAELFNAWKKIPPFNENEAVTNLDENSLSQDALAVYSQCLLDDLDKLLLIRDLYEQTLIYTRYGAKAAGE